MPASVFSRGVPAVDAPQGVRYRHEVGVCAAIIEIAADDAAMVIDAVMMSGTPIR